MIVIYADESGTHDPTGEKDGSAYPIIAGFAATIAVWDSFISEWEHVLKQYDVGYFHGRELREAQMAKLHNKPATKELLKNPYFKAAWSLQRIEQFRKKLTKVAAKKGKVPIVGNVSIPVLNRLKGKITLQNLETILGDDPYKFCMADFFNNYHLYTWLKWGKFKSHIQFIFDQNPRKEWQDAIREVFEAYQKEDSRMSGPSFEDKKKRKFFGLQAADLLAYRSRQLTEFKAQGNFRSKIEQLDFVLFDHWLQLAKKHDPQLKPFLT